MIDSKGLNDMENEKFQEIVLEHLAKLTQEVTELKTGQQRLEDRQDRMETKLDRVYENTARLTEEVTVLKNGQAGMEAKLDTISEDMKFLKYKEFENEAELFKVKSYLKITK
jgi:predicted nuclease with TOPRIM domain